MCRVGHEFGVKVFDVGYRADDVDVVHALDSRCFSGMATALKAGSIEIENAMSLLLAAISIWFRSLKMKCAAISPRSIPT